MLLSADAGLPALLAAYLLTGPVVSCAAAGSRSDLQIASTPILRVVSLAPSLTELVFALGFGSNLVGRSSACDYPPEAAKVSVVGGFGQPNWEVLQGLKPDIVIATDLEKPGLLKRLEDMGAKTLILSCEGWGPMKDAAREIGRVLGDPAASDRWVDAMDARIEALREKVAGSWGERPRPRVYVEVWNEPITTAAGETFLDDLVRDAGGVNIAGALGGTYVHVSAEWVIREDPDVILLAYMLGGASSARNLVRRPGWQSIRAVRSGAVCDSIPPDLLLRPGPRMIEGAERLADWLVRHAHTKP